jgi:Ca2+-binding RTX toxin-like protein
MDWGDGSTTPMSVTKAGSNWRIEAAHVYAADGVFTAIARIEDDDGEVTTKSITLSVSNGVGTTLRDGVLSVIGGAQRDNAILTLEGTRLIVDAKYGQTVSRMSFARADVKRIVAELGSGNDALKVDSRLQMPLVVDAGPGDDRISVGRGSSLVVGGDGNDLLYGGSGRDVLIGGAGRDQLFGYGGSDLLISGRTSFDADRQSFAIVFSEWRSARSFAVRVNNLRRGSGPILAGTGVSLNSSTLVRDSEVDLVMGGLDQDWHLFDSKKDVSRDRTRTEARFS